MAMDMNQMYQMLEQMSRDNSYGRIPDMTANNGWTLGAGIANGVNLKNNIMKEAEAARNRKRFDKNYNEMMKKHNNGSGGASTQQNATQMNQMPTLDGGMYNGRVTPQNGIYAQGRTDVAFPTINGNVTQMGNLYGNREWYGRNDGMFDQAFKNAENIVTNPKMGIPAKTYEVDRYPQELAGLTGEDLQRAGLAYNQRIDNGGSGFGQAIQRAENTVVPYVAPRDNIDTAAAEMTDISNNKAAMQNIDDIMRSAAADASSEGIPVADVVPMVTQNNHGGVPYIHGGGTGAFAPTQTYIDPAPNMEVENNPYRIYGLNGEYDSGNGNLLSAIQLMNRAKKERYNDTF